MSLKTFPYAFTALAIGGLSLAALAAAQGVLKSDQGIPDEVADAASVCSLELDTSGRGAILAAKVEPDTAMSGTYALTVTRSSGGNRSSIKQGGSFVAPADETTILSMSSFNSANGLMAELTLTVDGKRVGCAFPSYPLDS